MNQEERWIRILNYLDTHKTMNIKQMCESFDISRDTARRDIVGLTKQKMVVRTHGGVALPSFHIKMDDYRYRLNTESETKQLIGKKAASMITDNEMIYLDVSTTVNFVAQFLKARQVTIVTNSIDSAYVLAQSEDTTIHFLGGILNKSTRHVTGFSSLEKIKDYHFNKVFIGAAGITEDGIYYGSEEDIHYKRELIKHADQVFLLIDHTKHNHRQNYRALTFESVDTIITNQTMPNNLYEFIEEQGVEVLVTDTE